LAGFYQSSFTTPDGEDHRIAVTSMEPTYARQVRCFVLLCLSTRVLIQSGLPMFR
jgi:hypothetical protein